MGDNKVKDFQPPTEEAREGFSLKEMTEGLDRPASDEIEGFTGESNPHQDPDATLRQMRRKDETKGDPDERDVAGATPFEDTPHGREETKQDKAGAANQNG
ncbi:MAG TPA: hypothetical protein VJV05_06930 [Pyrinomonadaceae bacterium]|nr:hypothetical protein [Pyrinomonadaceae bacterium]